MSAPRHELRVQAGAPEHGERLDSVLSRRISFLSRSQARRLITDRRVLVFSDWKSSENGTTVTRPSVRVQAGQLLLVSIDSPMAEALATAALSAPNEDPDCDTAIDRRVLYEDEHLLAVDKPPHCSIHPSARYLAGSLIERIHRYQGSRNDLALATPCHRLDRETSGVVLLAKTGVARATIGSWLEREQSLSSIEARPLLKTYLALVTNSSRSDTDHGPTHRESDAVERDHHPSPFLDTAGRGEAANPSTPVTTLESFIGPDRASRVPVKRHATVSSEPESALARTEWRWLERREHGSLVELVPHTGRQHQLRVHAAMIGHPLWGDALYLGGDDVFLRQLAGTTTDEDRKLLVAPRLALHAARLELEHPITGQPLKLLAPWPRDLAEVWDHPRDSTLTPT